MCQKVTLLMRVPLPTLSLWSSCGIPWMSTRSCRRHRCPRTSWPTRSWCWMTRASWCTWTGCQEETRQVFPSFCAPSPSLPHKTLCFGAGFDNFNENLPAGHKKNLFFQPFTDGISLLKMRFFFFFVSLKINTFPAMGVLTSMVSDDSISNLCLCWVFLCN